jgi:hypothetical protein
MKCDLEFIFLLFRGVLETLIRRHFPAPVSALASINWSLFDNDPTLPRSCRKRKRAVRRPRTTTFQDDSIMSDSDDSSSPGGSDSAVESSSDDENDKGETSDSDSDSSSEGKSSSLDSDKEDFNPFGSSGESCANHIHVLDACYSISSTHLAGIIIQD